MFLVIFWVVRLLMKWYSSFRIVLIIKMSMTFLPQLKHNSYDYDG